MTHSTFPARSHWLLFAALTAAVPAMASVAEAQTKTAPVSVKAFTTGVTAAKKQAEALAKQATTEASKTAKAVVDAQAQLKVAEAQTPPTDALKAKIVELQQQIDRLQEIAAKIEKVAQAMEGMNEKLAALIGQDPCASDTKGPGPKLAEVRRIADGIVGSITSEMAAARTQEKTQPSPKLKATLAAYSKSLQSMGTPTSKLSDALKKLEQQTVTMGACP